MTKDNKKIKELIVLAESEISNWVKDDEMDIVLDLYKDLIIDIKTQLTE